MHLYTNLIEMGGQAYLSAHTGSPFCSQGIQVNKAGFEKAQPGITNSGSLHEQSLLTLLMMGTPSIADIATLN